MTLLRRLAKRKDRAFKVGDKVRAAEGLATVREVYAEYENRAGERVKEPNYLIEFDTWGSSIRFASELTLADKDDGAA